MRRCSGTGVGGSGETTRLNHGEVTAGGAERRGMMVACRRSVDLISTVNERRESLRIWVRNCHANPSRLSRQADHAALNEAIRPLMETVADPMNRRSRSGSECRQHSLAAHVLDPPTAWIDRL
jgi:hypothetical protein